MYGLRIGKFTCFGGEWWGVALTDLNIPVFIDD